MYFVGMKYCFASNASKKLSNYQEKNQLHENNFFDKEIKIFPKRTDLKKKIDIFDF